MQDYVQGWALKRAGKNLPFGPRTVVEYTEETVTESGNGDVIDLGVGAHLVPVRFEIVDASSDGGSAGSDGAPPQIKVEVQTAFDLTDGDLAYEDAFDGVYLGVNFAGGEGDDTATWNDPESQILVAGRYIKVFWFCEDGNGTGYTPMGDDAFLTFSVSAAISS